MRLVGVVLLAVLLVGCEGLKSPEGGPDMNKIALTVDFEKGRSLRYEVNSDRNITINWTGEPAENVTDSDKISKTTESLEMVLTYKPVDIDPLSTNTIEVNCEKVKAKKTSSKGGRLAGKDAVEALGGKSAAFEIGPTGKIEDDQQLRELIKQAAQSAFRATGGGVKTKDPDMIDDFIAAQWFLWDVVASAEQGTEGMDIGQSWQSKLLVPNTMVLRNARNVVYTLEEVQQTENGRVAVIRASYSLFESAPKGWPMPYSGRFRLSGTFGFFRSMLKGLDMKHLEGDGKYRYNIDAGRLESSQQNYTFQIETKGPGPMGINPKITVKQDFSVELVEAQTNPKNKGNAGEKKD